MTDAQVSLQLFPGYAESDTRIFAEFPNPEAKPEPGFVVDFIGSRIRTTSLWKEARALDGQLIGIPVPADFHAEAIEWIGLLKAVRTAAGQYIAMELGAGFGPWSVAGGLAARRRGIANVRLYAVEGDSHHFQLLRQHFTDNGFEPDRHCLFEAAVGTRAGVAQWPILENPSEAWGSRLIADGNDCAAHGSQRTKQVSVLSMLDLIRREPRWDLVHIDVQGDEVALCRSCIEDLNARVRWIVVGTHSRKVDGDLLELMCHAGWLLENEKPAKFAFAPNPATLEAMTTIDGTQVWRNPRLLCEGDPLSSFAQMITSTVREFRVKARGAYYIDINVKNTGTQPWFGGSQLARVDASYRWHNSEGNVLPNEGNRTLLNRPVLRPGESEALRLEVVAPRDPGPYTLWISMVQEGVDWFYRRGAKPLILLATVE